jgi:hypothetical protein
MANVLLYLNAGIWVLWMLAYGVRGIYGMFALLAVVAVFAGLGIANEKKLGYWGALAVAALNVLILAFIARMSSFNLFINLVFGVALLVLLLHPMSRSYQRIWFKKLNPGRRR